MRIQIPIIGQAYTHRSLDLSAQACRNWYPEFNKEANAFLSLQPWPGLELFCEGSGADGGMTVFQSALWKVSGNTLYKITSAGVSSPIGTINGFGLCTFASNDTTLVIVRDGYVYSTNGSTLTQATDGDFENPKFVTFLNNQCIYDGAGQRFVVSDADALTTINGLNFAAKESRGDDLVRPYIFTDTLYLFGERSIMQWWNSGVGNPPFDPIQHGTIECGLLAPWSIGHNSNYLYFLGNDYQVYRLLGAQIESISTVALVDAIQNYPNPSDAIGFCLSWEGQNFYYLKFNTGQTWVYSETTNGWFELTTGVAESPYAATSYANVFNRHLIGIGGNVYALSETTFTNGGEIMIRERVSSTLHAGLLRPGYEGKRITVNELELVIKNVGLLSGQGSAPSVMLGTSGDGRHWQERQLRGNPLGQYTWRINTRALGCRYEWLFRVRISDPIRCSILSANADVEVAI